MRVLLIEPYYAGSHRAWADGWAESSEHDVHLITHEAEFWRWRMRGGAVTLAEDVAAWVAEHGRPDALVVSDMIDLAAFLGLTRRVLSPDTPVVLYMHENQLTHPLGPGQRDDESLLLVNWKNVLSADAVWWNSDFHRTGFFAEAERLLNRQADRKHLHLLAGAETRSMVLPVGVHTAGLIAAERSEDTSDDAGPPLILWNQRWDHDKNPGAVFRALVKMAEAGIDFRFALAGENQRVDPQEFDWVQDVLRDRIVHVGHAPRAEYEELLLRSDVVVSAAHHEFFGISIVEAVAAGAVPVLPHRLSYPEVIPEQWHAALYGEGELRTRLVEVVTDLGAARSACGGVREAMAQWDWAHVAPRYDAALAATTPQLFDMP